ncbi:hypothetical protein K437DRAFT_154538 [Tilletiaria anomala UBC 951]|uniref:Uncharacterized protein n=1 Tax=Tilletiaria anomala (strain ATCC 24038 / CBS 436.72 / UBC 951) TaxID=1037660 RepID=A0A066VX06_TILAU|nr:uncharacterized protein K437DRAFT_154538 [Tilletiaria anomala UBC 951]KDN43085.1 hypothetical protein K437DRAFT_154538 [Tilletiaria anomala UBC 951]
MYMWGHKWLGMGGQSAKSAEAQAHPWPMQACCTNGACYLRMITSRRRISHMNCSLHASGDVRMRRHLAVPLHPCAAALS